MPSTPISQATVELQADLLKHAFQFGTALLVDPEATHAQRETAMHTMTNVQATVLGLKPLAEGYDHSDGEQDYMHDLVKRVAHVTNLLAGAR